MHKSKEETDASSVLGLLERAQLGETHVIARSDKIDARRISLKIQGRKQSDHFASMAA